MPPPGNEPLLNAIRQQPDDTVLRLAYADWLDENDDPARAEFIRVQCRLAELGHGPMWPQPRVRDVGASRRGLAGEAAGLVRRQEELWEENGEQWLGELPDLPGCTVLFHRGFATAVMVDENPGGLIRAGEQLLASAPVTRVVFRDCRPEALEVALLRPWFDGVRGLTVSRSGGKHVPEANQVAEVLAGAEHLSGLRDLSLFRLGVTGDGAEVLADAEFFRRLVRVDLSHNNVDASGALAVSVALDPARLVVLDLSGNRIPIGVRAVIIRKHGERVCLEDDATPPLTEPD
jgi:uncharacterized protein (TIGR02996 family)